MTAVGAIAVAVVTALGAGAGAQAKQPPGGSTAAPTATAAPQSTPNVVELRAVISGWAQRTLSDQARAIVVSGLVDGFRDAVASGREIPTYRVVAEPIGPPPADLPEPTRRPASQPDDQAPKIMMVKDTASSSAVYFSDPVTIKPDGTWEVEVEIPAQDKRDMLVYLAACSWQGEAPIAQPPKPETFTLTIDDVVSAKVRVAPASS